MPRKLLKRLMPDHKTMREHPHLKKFGHRLADPKLWHLNRHSVAGGIAVGLLIAFVPTVGQMVIAAALAILLRVNLPVAVAGVWLTNPLTMAPIFFFAYKVGAWVLQLPVEPQAFSMTWDWFSHEFLSIWQPLLLGSLICGTLAALFGMLIVKLSWRLVVIHHWRQRKRRCNHAK